MDKISEALKSLLPEDQVNEVADAVKAMISESLSASREELESEFQQKLSEAYTQLESEKAEIESKTEEGYKQAYAIIDDLRGRLEKQKEEFDAFMHTQYEEAYKLIEAEKSKNENESLGLYEAYDKKLQTMKMTMVDKLDQYLQEVMFEIKETVKREVINDPRTVEHKVALDKIVEVAAAYLSDEDYSNATSVKLEENIKAIEEMKGQIRTLEAKNVRLSTQNTMLGEQLKEAKQVITENVVAEEKKEKTESAKNVSGKGTRLGAEQTVVIAEHNSPEPTKVNKDSDEVEVPQSLKEEYQLLAGIKKNV